jgi:hypothetical protein
MRRWYRGGINRWLKRAAAIRQVKELGRGCFGSVWLAKWRGVEIALKEMLHQVGWWPAFWGGPRRRLNTLRLSG